MSDKLGSILIRIIIFAQLAYAKSYASYQATAIVFDIQGSTSTTSKAFEGYVKHDNISTTTKFLDLPRTSGLSKVISTISSASSSNLTTKNGKEVLHLSPVMKKGINILKEIYWNRTVTTSDITKCSQACLLKLCKT